MKKYFFTKTQGLIIKSILTALVILPIVLLITKYENKLILVALIFLGFSCVVGIFVIDEYTDKYGDLEEEYDKNKGDKKE